MVPDLAGDFGAQLRHGERVGQAFLFVRDALDSACLHELLGALDRLGEVVVQAGQRLAAEPRARHAQQDAPPAGPLPQGDHGLPRLALIDPLQLPMHLGQQPSPRGALGAQLKLHVRRGLPEGLAAAPVRRQLEALHVHLKHISHLRGVGVDALLQSGVLALQVQQGVRDRGVLLLGADDRQLHAQARAVGVGEGDRRLEEGRPLDAGRQLVAFNHHVWIPICCGFDHPHLRARLDSVSQAPIEHLLALDGQAHHRPLVLQGHLNVRSVAVLDGGEQKHGFACLHPCERLRAAGVELADVLVHGRQHPRR
mmetsp:Transcript_5820/g.17210  ORF Transcript_5820/g.17210 Transcript_5820/m.17210 type:complete len:310 (+) Transcript_5820:248-1177(+)